MNAATRQLTARGKRGPAQPGRARAGRARAAARGGIGRRPTWLVAPAAVLLAVLIAFPMLVDTYISFFRVTIYTLRTWWSSPFTGLGNYIQALTQSNIVSGTAAHALWVSASFSLLTTAIATPIGFVAAISLNHRFRGRGLLRGWFLVPYVIPGVVTAMVGRALFLNPGGLVDHSLSTLHLGRNVLWLAGPNAFWAMLAVEVWAAWPLTYMMVLAGLASVDSDLYDASEVDGGGYLAKLRHIVLPQVRNVLLLSVVISTIFHFGNFTLPYVMFSSPPPPAVNVLPVAIYYNAFVANDYSLASAIAVIMVIVVLIPGIFYIRATRLSQVQGGGNR